MDVNEEKLPPPWQKHYSKSNKKHYYFNSKTNKKAWFRPELPFGWTYDIDKDKRHYYYHISDVDTISYSTPTAISNEKQRPRIEHSPRIKPSPRIESSTSNSQNTLASTHSSAIHHPPRESPTVKSSSTKRTFDILNDSQEPNQDNDSINNKKSKVGNDQQAAAAFYDNLNRNSTASRGVSRLFHMRALNNWVKSLLINRYGSLQNNGSNVLDLACGKGGDLSKWSRARIRSYVGIDIALQSLRDAVDRITSNAQWNKLDIRLAQADLGAVEFTNSFQMWDKTKGWSQGELLRRGEKFDVVSMQFALHYLFGEESRAEMFFQNVQQVMQKGGHFIATTVDCNVLIQKWMQNVGRYDEEGNMLPIQIFDDQQRESCTITFDAPTQEALQHQRPLSYGLRYHFRLKDTDDTNDAAVDAPEYLVPTPVLVDLLAKFDFELVEQTNFHDFVIREEKEKAAAELMQKMKVADFSGSVSQVEWDIIHLYQVLVFRYCGS